MLENLALYMFGLFTGFLAAGAMATDRIEDMEARITKTIRETLVKYNQ